MSTSLGFLRDKKRAARPNGQTGVDDWIYINFKLTKLPSACLLCSRSCDEPGGVGAVGVRRKPKIDDNSTL